jgi:membrane protease YdiL (CAAX protease family)
MFLGITFLSFWVRRDPKIWGTLLGFTLLSGLIAGHITWTGLICLALLLSLWMFYKKKPHSSIFILIVSFSALFAMRLIPGYPPFFLTPKFALGFQSAWIGLFPLAFLVPLAQQSKDWIAVIRGVVVGCIGLVFLALVATLSGATHWDFKLPTFVGTRLLSNFFFTCIPQEGFYRGFVQTTLCTYFKNIKLGKILALILSSLIFTATHIYWSPNFQLLLFVFLAGLIYGTVYLISKRIESSIISHFILNFIHMTFFSYHAM